jgi:hypothetical protein
MRWLVAAALCVFLGTLTLVVVAGLRTSAGGAAAVQAPPAPQRAPKPKPARPPASIGVVAVGDMTFGRAGVTPPGGAEELLRGVRRSLRGDLVIGNLETTLGTGGSARCTASSTSCYSFQAAPSTAVGLRRVGFDAVNVANNHANDYGVEGQAQTSSALAHARLRYTGRPGQITVVRVGSLRVALVGLAPYRYAQNLLDLPAARELVRRAARRAELVVAMLHVGAEGAGHEHVHAGMETYLGESRGDPMLVAHALVESGADLVIGSGPHVLRGLEWYRGRLIAYSLGNFTGYHTLNTTGVSGISAILSVDLDTTGRLRRGRLVPVRLVGTGTPVLDATRQAVALAARLGREDFGKRGVRLRPNGAIVVERANAVAPST